MSAYHRLFVVAAAIVGPAVCAAASKPDIKNGKTTFLSDVIGRKGTHSSRLRILRIQAVFGDIEPDRRGTNEWRFTGDRAVGNTVTGRAKMALDRHRDQRGDMRKIAFSVACLALLYPASGVAQQPAPQQTWQHVVDVDGRGEIKDMVAADNGDLVVAGFLRGPGNAPSDAWLARYSPDGHELWSRRLGGEYRDEALDLAIAPDASIVIGGWRDVRLSQSIQASNGYLAKYSPDGNLLWEVTLDNPGPRSSFGQVVVLADGSVLAAGKETGKDDDKDTRALLVKVSSDGHILWRVNPGTPPGPTRDAQIDQVGSHGEVNVFVSLAVANGQAWSCAGVGLDKGEWRVGACHGSPLFPSDVPGGLPRYYFGARGGLTRGDPYILRVDEQGKKLWVRVLESSAIDGFNAVAQTPDGGVVGVGFVVESGKVEMHNWDGLIVKLDAGGAELWRRTIGGSRRDEFTGVVAASDGSMFVAGYTGSQGQDDWAPWLMHLSSTGELIGEAKRDLELRQK
jgi:hypothetical protein